MHRNEVQSRQVPVRHPPHKYQVRILNVMFDVNSIVIVLMFKIRSNLCKKNHLCRCDGLLLLHCTIYFDSFYDYKSFHHFNSIFFVAFHCMRSCSISNRILIFPPFLVVATQSSQTLTQDGSSFESASSMYSLARVDAICDDGPSTAAPIDDTLPLPPPVSIKPSPSHSVSSSSSGSYRLPGGVKKPAKVISTSPRSSVVKVPIAAVAAKPKTESISEDEKSEKRYSSSGYYESPHDDGKY